MWLVQERNVQHQLVPLSKLFLIVHLTTYDLTTELDHWPFKSRDFSYSY